MKILQLILLILLFGCHPKQTTSTLLSKKDNSIYYGLKITGDSAYITKKIGMQILKHVFYNDTTDLIGSWTSYKDSDTIGKYFKLQSTENYIACIGDHTTSFTSYAFIEFKKDNEGISIIAKERYYQGNYSCCWDNFNDGFKRLGDFLCFKYCNTGSGYCSSKLILFKHVIPQNVNGICVYTWEAFFGTSLTSTMTIKDSVLTVNYKLVKNKVITTDDNINYIPLTKEYFKIEYFFNGSDWYSRDSTLIKKTIIL
jgi:hypothetical protein